MKTATLGILACLFVSQWAILAGAADWRQFRGPGGDGTGTDRGLPTHWTETENVVWRTPLPGLGGSSPITLGNRVYLTCYTGCGIEPNQGDMSDFAAIRCLSGPKNRQCSMEEEVHTRSVGICLLRRKQFTAWLQCQYADHRWGTPVCVLWEVGCLLSGPGRAATLARRCRHPHPSLGFGQFTRAL